MDIATGTELRGYLVQDPIGEGGFGNVFQALQSSVSREVAIKVILPEYANKPEFIRRFETEAQLIARLEHLHIVPLYDYWRGPDGAYLVMRLMRGGSLEDLINTGPIEIESIALIIDQIAAALDSAHKHGVIHRDIKPSNILLDEDNNAYLSDFGIAKDMEHDQTNLSSPDAVIGTLDYLAPEQAIKEAITPQTDIYSLGVVLYEMLVGEHPYPGVSGVQRVFKHINEPLPKIIGLDPEISDTINQVVQKATQKNPANRYESVLGFADAFRKAAALSSSRMDSQLIELLTPREQEVLSYLIKGKSNMEIADLLTIEFSTVKWYLRQIYKKFNVRSRVQAIVRAREINLIVDDQESAGRTSSVSPLQILKNPYKGLKAFQAIDEQDYFGREDLIQTLLKRLGEKHNYSRFLAVVGPSGSGKSSLVKAGLIPALWRGQLPGSEKWFIIDMMLGEHPFDELEVALTRIAADQQHNLREQLQRDSRGLVRAANLVLPDDQSELVLVLDQFEELFTIVRDEDVRTQFLELLFIAVTDPRSRIRIVVTLRADFYDRPLHYPNFGDLVRSRIETVMPLNAEELERAIVQPAKGVGVEFEDGLVSSIINEAHYQSGALPLMQYALTELFELREDRMLTHENFHRIGGIIGAIAKSAEAIYKELDSQGKEAVRQMFLRLVNLGDGSEDTKRRVQRSELLSITTNPEVMDEIIDTFANYRLVSLDNDPVSRAPVVEVAHEAILHEWERLDAWLDESRDDIRQERQLSNATAEWKEHGDDISFLLRGSRLSFFEQWIDETQLALTPLEKDFINQSIIVRDREIQEETERAAREKRLEVRNRRFLQTLVVVLALAVAVSVWLASSARSAQRTAESESQARATAQVLAEEQSQEALLQADARAEAEAVALEQREQALIQASIGLAALAEQELVGFFPDRSVLLALEALENYPYTPQAYSALLHAVNTNRLRLTITPHTALLTSHLRLSQDGTKMITSAQDGTVKISDIRTGKEVLKIETEYDQTRFVRWSPDETKILFVSHYGKAGWFNTDNRKPFIAIYDALSGELIRDFPAGDDWFACWSPDGSKVITSGSSNLISVWDAATGQKITVLDKHSDIARVAPDYSWSSDGIHFVSSSDDGTAIIWDLETGEDIFTLVGPQAGIYKAKYSYDGAYVATIDFEEKVIIWDTQTGEQILVHIPNIASPNYLNDIYWAPASHQIAVRTTGPDSYILDAVTGNIVNSFSGHGVTTYLSWSPTGDRIATSGEDGKVIIWDAETGSMQFTLFGHSSQVGGTGWSKDGKWVISGGVDGTIKIWDTELAPQITEGLGLYPYGGSGGGAWSPDSSMYARAYLGGAVVMWDAETGESVFQIEGLGTLAYVHDWHSDGRLLVNINLLDDGLLVVDDWNPDGSLFVNVDIQDDGLMVVDGNSGEELLSFETGNEDRFEIGLYTMDAKFSPDGTMIAAAGWDTDVRILNASTGELVRVLDDHLGGIWSLSWSPDSTRLVTGAWDYTAKIWEVETGEVLKDLYPDTSNLFVYAVAWSPKGDQIATSSQDGITIWDIEGEQEPLKLVAHAGDITDLNWSSDGNYLLSSSADGTGRLWDAQTGLEISVYEIGTANAGFISPDMTKIAFSSEDGTVRFYPFLPELDDLIEYAYECCVVRELTAQERLIFGLDPTD